MLLVVNGFVLVLNARIYRRMKGYVTNSRQLDIVLEDLHMGQHQINFMVHNAD